MSHALHGPSMSHAYSLFVLAHRGAMQAQVSTRAQKHVEELMAMVEKGREVRVMRVRGCCG